MTHQNLTTLEPLMKEDVHSIAGAVIATGCSHQTLRNRIADGLPLPDGRFVKGIWLEKVLICVIYSK